MVDTETYTFDELDDRAKARARDNHRYDEVRHDWWDAVYEDAMRMGALMGIEVGTRERRTMNDKTVQYPDISFSGFYSQGDGACWSGYLDTGKFAGAVERIKAETGWNAAMDDNPLIVLATQAEELHAAMAVVQVANRLCSDEENRDWPDCEIGIRINVEGRERSFYTRVDTSLLPDEIEKDMNRFVEAFATWIYDSLEAEHDHLTDDEYVEDRIRGYDMRFDEDGNDS